MQLMIIEKSKVSSIVHGLVWNGKYYSLVIGSKETSLVHEIKFAYNKLQRDKARRAKNIKSIRKEINRMMLEKIRRRKIKKYKSWKN